MNAIREIYTIRREIENLDIKAAASERMIPLSTILAFIPLIIYALRLAKIFVGPKGKKKIDEVLEWAKGITG